MQNRQSWRSSKYSTARKLGDQYAPEKKTTVFVTT
ncbi:Uncharacterised protein [Vibrio cholerae]|nr:Uncharacterised protein [Vibrio cholerae]